MYTGVNSNSSGRSCDPEVRMRTDQRVPRKPDARISRRDGRDARPCPRTRHTPRRTGTAHVCQHPTTSPVPRPRRLLLGTFEKCLLRSISIGCFCSSKPWQFYCWHAVASRNTKATHTAEQRGIQHLASLASSIRSGQLEPPSLSRRTNDVTNDARCTMGPGHAPGLEHENHQTSAATDSSTEGQRPPERDPHE
jgi:hypothetical protein